MVGFAPWGDEEHDRVEGGHLQGGEEEHQLPRGGDQGVPWGGEFSFVLLTMDQTGLQIDKKMLDLDYWKMSRVC